MATYARVEATGRVELLNAQGVRIDGYWWNPSKHVAVDLSRFRVGDVVYVEGDETADGERRWISAIDFADGYQRPPAQPQTAKPAATVYEPDPDDLPDSPARPSARQTPADRLAADRLACLQVAASVLTPWWVKKGVDPDRAVLVGFAADLVDYLHQPRTPRT